MAQYSYSFRDISDERSTVTIRVTEPTEVGANWETIVNTNEATVRSAILGVTDCNLAKHHVLLSEEKPNDTRPASEYAEREAGLRVFFTDDTTGDKGYITIPGPDKAALTRLAGTDRVELADGGVMAALVTALEANMLSKAGNAITVEYAEYVGRNS